MRPFKAHFVTSCQQILALGAVLAVLTPAVTVVSLDVVHRAPASVRGAERAGASLSAYAHEAATPSRVPTAPVAADLTEVQLTPRPGGFGRRTAHVRSLATGPSGTALVSRPQPVTGYGGVGVTWDPAADVDDQDMSFEVRSRTDGVWSEWSALEYHDEHAPDPDSPEGRSARPGTELVFVGDVDDVQLRATTERLDPPADMRLAVVEPGEEVETARQLPAIDTGSEPVTSSRTITMTSARVAAYTPKPTIYSRAQWGADESLRDRGSLRYFEVHAGFVHHTVNANGYSRSDVPGILRGIYAYHTRSRGWSDIGYNFLVDRFGRIWEGRYGGVDRPVVGAHTLGYNDYSFAMSAIGNFDVVEPRAAMVEAYGTLFAWKLSLHGVDPEATKQLVGSTRFAAINGHRDAGSTACPGRYLYAKLPRIRELAAAAQQNWSGRELQSDIAGTAHPDLFVRRAGDKRLFVLPTGGISGFRKPVTMTGLAAGADRVVASPDLSGDGIGDLLVRRADGTTRLHPGDGAGRYGAATRTTSTFSGRDLITPAGDLDGDRHNDVVARNGTRLNVYLGNGLGGFDRGRAGGDWSGYDLLAATGDVTGDGRPDILARDGSGTLWAHPGEGGRQLGERVAVAGAWGSWTRLSGYGDFTRDGRADLFGVDGSGRGWIIPARAKLAFGTPLGPFPDAGSKGLAGAAQVARDGLPDVVSVSGDDIRTYANRGTVDLASPIDTGIRLAGVNALFNAGDWDRDGHADLLYRRATDGALVLRRGDGTGHFADPLRIAGGFADVRLLAAVGDMTGDGWPDLMGQPSGSSMRLYPGNGLRGLKASYVAHSAISAARQVPVGRWDADGAPDSLFRSGSSLSLYPGNGPGGLTSRVGMDLDVGRYDWVVGVSDLGIGGHADLVVRERATGRLYAIRGTRAGFRAPRILGEGMGTYDLVG